MRTLQSELADLPRARRSEILDEISGHIAAAQAESEVDIRNLLDRVGEPVEIAEDARQRLGVRRQKTGALEVVALVLLAIGGLVVPVAGWLLGVALLWASGVWTVREKLLGTLVMPGGLSFPLLWLIFGDRLNRVLDFVDVPDVLVPWIFMAVIVAPLVTVTYLARQMRRRSA
jgi:hypothetical protein